jgi:hypothetical protein
MTSARPPKESVSQSLGPTQFVDRSPRTTPTSRTRYAQVVSAAAVNAGHCSIVSRLSRSIAFLSLPFGPDVCVDAPSLCQYWVNCRLFRSVLNVLSNRTTSRTRPFDLFLSSSAVLSIADSCPAAPRLLHARLSCALSSQATQLR